jgi:FMN-dependent NADH-azoreductase
MSTPMVRIHNSQTDEIIDREMNAEELAQLETDKVNQAKRLEEKIQTQADKAALLAKLGITADEAKLLLS